MDARGRARCRGQRVGRDAEVEPRDRIEQALDAVGDRVLFDLETILLGPASEAKTGGGGTGSEGGSPASRSGGIAPLGRPIGGGGFATAIPSARWNSASSVRCCEQQSTTRNAARPASRRRSTGARPPLSRVRARLTNENLRWSRSSCRTTSTGGSSLRRPIRSARSAGSRRMRRSGTSYNEYREGRRSDDETNRTSIGRSVSPSRPPSPTLTLVTGRLNVRS